METPKYNEFLKKWSTEKNITSFFGSDKPDFLKAWNSAKTGNKVEMESMGREDINRAGEPFKKPKPKAKKQTAAEEVFTNPDLLKQIGSYTNPKNRVDDFFEKDEDGNERINTDSIRDLLLKRDIKYKSLRQYTELIDILAQTIYGLKSFDERRYSDKRYIIPAFRKVIAILLEKKLPDIDYEDFWRRVSNNYAPTLTEINNVSMKKLFPTWKNKGKRYKATYRLDLGA